MTLTCERCKKEMRRLERCNYCSKMICIACTKSSSRYQKTTRLVICKDCWGNIPKRSAFKRNSAEVADSRAEA